jgi:hypothetical protein
MKWRKLQRQTSYVTNNILTLMGKESVQGSLTSPTDPSNMKVKKAAGVSCSDTQRIETRGGKPEYGKDTRLKPLKKEGKQENWSGFRRICCECVSNDC